MRSCRRNLRSQDGTMLSKATHGRHILQSPAQQYLFSVENKIVSCASRAARTRYSPRRRRSSGQGSSSGQSHRQTISIPNTPKITTASKAPRSCGKRREPMKRQRKLRGPSPASRRISSKRKAESALSSSKKSITATAASSTGRKRALCFRTQTQEHFCRHRNAAELSAHLASNPPT